MGGLSGASILVTGGAGYIGSVVCAELAACGARVVAFDDLSTGHADALPGAVTLVRGSIEDRAALVTALCAFDVDAVVHLAARSLVGCSMRDPAAYWRTNVAGGLALLDAMRAAGVPRLVASSTAAVYAPRDAPLAEDAPLAPASSYGETKLALERAIACYSRAYGLRAIVLRYFNAAGASDGCGERHEPETHLIPVVLQAAEREEAVHIFGADYDTPDGTALRDYVHVADLARAHRLALAALAAGAPSATYNLGCGSGRSVAEVIATARAVTGAALPVRLSPRRPGDPPRLVADIARAADELGWRPRHTELGDVIASAWRFRRAADAPLRQIA
jgi:UDP-glucose 4-epimerase